MDWKSELVHGIYESVITHSLQEKIERLQDTFDIEQKSLDSDESHFSLALHLAKLIASTLASMKGDDKKSRQAQFCNQLLEVIGKNDHTFPVDAERIVEDLMYLLKVQDRGAQASRPPRNSFDECLSFHRDPIRPQFRIAAGQGNSYCRPYRHYLFLH